MSNTDAANPLAEDLDHILGHTVGVWDELRGARVFITGGTGFFGCWLLESFAWANRKLGLGAHALVLTRDVEAFRRKAPHLAENPSIAFHTGDVRTFEFPPGTFTHVIHAATPASATLIAEQPLEMLDIIIEGTRRTLDFARACGARKFLFTSSGAVYGRQPPELTHIPEDYSGAPDPTVPSSAYGEGKRVAELLCCTYHRQFGLDARIARCFAFAGPHLPLDAHYAAGNFIRDAMRGGPIVISGDGTPRRSYLYAADLAVWLWTILLRGQSCRPYNVGSENGISIRDLADLVAGTIGPGIEVKVAKQAAPGRPAEQYVPSTRRAQAELGLTEQIGLQEAMRRTMTFLKATAG